MLLGRAHFCAPVCGASIVAVGLNGISDRVFHLEAAVSKGCVKHPSGNWQTCIRRVVFVH
jgi:hypothetical protein